VEFDAVGDERVAALGDDPEPAVGEDDVAEALAYRMEPR
jgi:hypothetical protein